MMGWCARYTPHALLGIAVLAVLFGFVTLCSMFVSWKLPILVQLSVDRAEFTVAPPEGNHEPSELSTLRTSSLGFLDLTIEGYSTIQHEGVLALIDLCI